jgi:hypothetical protein
MFFHVGKFSTKSAELKKNYKKKTLMGTSSTTEDTAFEQDQMRWSQMCYNITVPSTVFFWFIFCTVH